MRDQKELKEMYMEIIKNEIWPNDESMQAYAKKTCAYVVELSDGSIVDLDKPSIKKDFCFGAGMYARATDEEMNAAENMADLARNSQEYFKSKNLEEINNRIQTLEMALDGNYEAYSFLHYTGQEKGSKLKSYSVCRLCQNPEYEPGFWSNCEELQRMGNEDIKRILSGLEEVKKAFEKRINTYLKRYGTSKVNVWTYICD